MQNSTLLHNKQENFGKVSFGLHAYNVNFWDSNQGIQNTNRVDGTTDRKLYTKVVDQVLNAPTYFSRILSQGEQFNGKTEDVTYDVLADTQGQFFTGLETLNSSATNTTVTGSYAHTAYTQPIVSIMLESFANSVGALSVINLDTFKYEKAAAQALQSMGSAIYSDGSANQPLGLAQIVNDSGSVGGLSRSTYPVLNATNTASGGTLTLAKMATLHDAVSAAGLMSEEPNAGLTTKTVWSLYEQLLTPNVRASYDEVGYNKVSVRGQFAERGSATMRNSAGFSALSYRNMYVLKDDFATSGVFFFLNEDKFDWKGRTVVPSEYKDAIEKVNLGTASAYEGTGAESLDMPSEFNGFFYQKPLTIPDQAGRIARFYVIGQTVPTEFRRSGKLTGVTGI